MMEQAQAAAAEAVADAIPPGVPMRDWFAGLAMQGILAAQIHGFNDRPANGPFASMAYEMADAMLKAREEE